jgi:hypothetical protein
MIEYYSGNRLDTIDTIPTVVMDLILDGGRVGIGSSNDRVYFDNVKAGWVGVEGKFSDVEILGEAGNYEEANPWLWGVIEEDGDTRYGIVEPKEEGGNRKSILQGESYDGNWVIDADVKLFKRATGTQDQTLFEDAGLFFCWHDADNFATAMYFIHSGPGVTGNPVGQGDAFGISGIRFTFEGQEYRLTKLDDPGDPVEEIPPESCIPYEDDTSFDAWYAIRLEREGSIFRMIVDDEEYWALDVDTLTIAQIYGGDVASWQFSHWATVPQGAKDLLKGAGQIGIGSSNDKVYFDNVKAEALITAVDELDDTRSAVLIYPNPAKDMFTVEKIDNIRRIEMYNLSGQRVMNMETHGESSIAISTSRFRSGMYLMRFISDDGAAAVGKIMIQ